MPDTQAPTTNQLGLELGAYKGARSTLCAGCGHDAITGQIVRALFEMNVPPHRVIKMSGIGCSSKTPAYFLSQAHGFNGLHGRMPAIATGALLANRQLLGIGVSGDGDTASIGLGQFLHLIRRNVPMVYLIENNGVYGLTKGQFSATADEGSVQKRGQINQMAPIDCCALAIQLGCGYVARSFSGDIPQLVTLIKGAIAHQGTAVIDIVSPCVTFNNHEGSTKSYPYAKAHESPLHQLDYVPAYAPIVIEQAEGTEQTVTLHDGSNLRLKKLDGHYDPTDRQAALALLATETDRLVTGLLYHDPSQPAIADQLDLTDTPLAALPETRLRPDQAAFQRLMSQF